MTYLSAYFSSQVVLHGWRVGVGVACATLLFSMAASAQVASDPSPAAPPARMNEAAIERALTGLVKLKSVASPRARSNATLGKEREGNGILISPRLVLTIGYLVIEADEIEITDHKDRKLPGRLVGFDHDTGFGLVRLFAPAEGEPILLGDASAIKERDPVLAAGARGNVSPAFVVSRREFTAAWEYMLDRAIFTSPPIPEWGGAALFEPSGKLVGVGSLYVRDAGGVGRTLPGNMFVPVDILRPILDDLIAKGQRTGAQRPWLGISTFEDEDGVNVGRTSPEGPGDNAGLERGDIITAVANRSVKTLAEFYRAVWARGEAGVSIPLTITRGKEELTVNVKSVARNSYFARASQF
ncbi:MAG: serine protease [Betaproteobacteria bacterium]|nr:MAG: serine protease [Betaproteobacteria bacterium]